VQAIWDALARSTDITSPLALKADAEAEAARQVAFLGGPLAIDEVLVPGSRADLWCKPVTIRIDRLGYEDGRTVFVFGVAESDDVDTTTLTVLRRLA
jgi:hypothetical protein